MTEYQTDHEREAYSRGVEAAKSAATWVLDGNTPGSTYAHVLELMDAGDPRVDEYLPAQPNLSGEWADDPTPQSLARDIFGVDLDYFLTEDEIERSVKELADAWEQGVSDAFESECERLLRAAVA